ncbi:MAG TPA: hypothetical protein DCX03_05820 [Bacteroidales bacterium]|nr:hypothetical protein [Bacteroidales bacterium]
MAGFVMLVLSLILNWIPLLIICALFFDVYGVYLSIILVAAAGIFAISPLNEKIGRICLGCRPATTEERQKISGAWKAVISSIGSALDDKTRDRFDKVGLFVSDEKLPNAFALGRNTVCVTKGLLNLSSANEITGVLAHEAGHLHFGDSQRLAVSLAANQLGVMSYRVMDFFSRIFQGVTKGVSDVGFSFARSNGGLIAIFGFVLWIGAVLITLCLRIIFFLFKTAMDISIRAVGRNEEFRADLFAKNIGYGSQLAKFLKQIEALDTAPKDIWAVLYRTHPPTAERIDRLQQAS